MQGLENKVDQLEIINSQIEPHILAFAEHHQKKDGLKTINIKNYILVADYCRSGMGKGGTVIYVKRDIVSFLNVNKLKWIGKFNVEGVCEFCGITINVNNTVTTLLAIYRPPNSDVSIFFSNFILIVQKILKKSNIIVVGDYNIQFIEKIDTVSKQFFDIINSFNLKILVDTPTRITETTSSCIDNVLTDCNEWKAEVVITSISDHDGIIVELKQSGELKLNNHIKRRKLTKQSINNLKTNLSRQKWEEVFHASSIEHKYEKFLEIFTYHFDSTCPEKLIDINKSNHKNNKKWYTCSLLREKENLHTVYDQFKMLPDPGLWAKYKILKKQYEKNVRKQKNKYIGEKLKQVNYNTKEVWKVIHGETKPPILNKNITLIDGTHTISDPKIVAHYFNDYFTNVTGSSDKMTCNQKLREPENFINNYIEKLLFFNELTVQDTIKIIKDLKCKRSSGYDGIPTSVVKDCVEQIAVPITHLINSSFNEATFPHLLKISKIIPIHKSGNVQKAENYRPISHLPSFSKIFERAVHNQLISYLEKYKKLNPSQFGFRPKKSTKQALTAFLEFVLDNLESKKIVSGCFIDLSKAFDMVRPKILIEKLSNIGIQGHCLLWIQSYLENRQQYVHISEYNNGRTETFQSTLNQTIVGVPQGSILGPLLYIIYVNDIIETVPKENIISFADDTSIFKAGINHENLEIDTFITMNEISSYFTNLGLKINPNKTKFININLSKRTNKRPLFNIILDQKELTQAENVRFLGVTVDSNLNWNEHVNQLSSKLASGLHIIRKVSKLNCKPISISCYYAFIYSHISYSIILWGLSSLQNLNRIFILQKRAIRYIDNLNSLDSCRDSFINNNILTVPSIFILECIMYCIVNNQLKTVKKHSYNTRNISFAASHRLKIYESKPSYIGNKFYSKLPPQLKEEVDKKCFKNKLRNWLIQKCFYKLVDLLEPG